MDIHNFLTAQGIKVDHFELIEQALTHSSYANEHGSKADNERLGFNTFAYKQKIGLFEQ